MGEAKRRGNKETRTLQGIEKAKRTEHERVKKIIEREQSLTPEQKEAHRARRRDISMLLGLIGISV